MKYGSTSTFVLKGLSCIGAISVIIVLLGVLNVFHVTVYVGERSVKVVPETELSEFRERLSKCSQGGLGVGDI